MKNNTKEQRQQIKLHKLNMNKRKKKTKNKQKLQEKQSYLKKTF